MYVPVAQKYLQLKERIADLAIQCSRKPSDIEIVAVSKYFTWQHVFPAYQAGCRDFGENRLQDILVKMEEAPADIRWHFIGTLQKNKVQKAVESKFVLIHSVDSFELAQKISKCSREAGLKTAILLQINTSGEASKHGLSPKECLEQFENFMSLPSLKIEGFMTMAPLTQDDRIIHRCFADLRILRDKLEGQAGISYKLPYLSMGMSEDFPIAIQEGATHLRIGSALFKEF